MMMMTGKFPYILQQINDFDRIKRIRLNDNLNV